MAHLTANNGGFLIELVYNNLLVGFLDEYNIQLRFVDTAVMITDGFCDWNLVKHVTRVSIFLRHRCTCLTSLDTYPRVSIVV